MRKPKLNWTYGDNTFLLLAMASKVLKDRGNFEAHNIVANEMTEVVAMSPLVEHRGLRMADCVCSSNPHPDLTFAEALELVGRYVSVEMAA